MLMLAGILNTLVILTPRKHAIGIFRYGSVLGLDFTYKVQELSEADSGFSFKIPEFEKNNPFVYGEI